MTEPLGDDTEKRFAQTGYAHNTGTVLWVDPSEPYEKVAYGHDGWSVCLSRLPRPSLRPCAVTW